MKTSTTDVAIVGYACRLPKADDAEAFWALLDGGQCVIETVQEGRWSRNRFGHADRTAAGKSYTWRAGQLADPWSFDPMFFGISPREALQMDPQQRLMLKVVWEALEHAGIPPSSLAGQEVGVYVGASSVDYSNHFVIDPSASDIQVMTGNTASILSNRVSYVLDLKGPSLTVDTACSSSIVALHEALEALRSGRIDTAIVSGVNMLLSPFPFVGFSRASMLSATGLCRAFDAAGDGYVRSEGAVAFVLQTVSAAVSAANPVRGVIVGSGINSDGRTAGLSLPSTGQQASLLKHVYERFEIDPNQLAFVEAHGTGTRVGDPAEAEALGAILGQRRSEILPIGSVKTNIGHLEAASGVAGLLKAQMALERGVLPASLHFETPNPDIDFDGLNIKVASRSQQLPASDRPLYAGVNSFGFGGANAHAVLRQPTSAEVVGKQAPAQAAPLVLSAQTPDALRSLAATYRVRLEQADAAETAAVVNAVAHGRERLDHRFVTVGTEPDAIRSALDAFLEGRRGPDYAVGRVAARKAPVAFMFSGNGSQWVGMGRQAYDGDEAFRASFDTVTRLFMRIAGWSLRTMLFSSDSDADFERTEVAQPLLFAVQVATVAALEARGLTASMVAGHSVGEVAAAWAAGALPLDVAVRLIHVRSTHQEVTRDLGGMAAVLASASQVEQAIVEGGYRTLELAADNSPRSTTVSGSTDELIAFGKDARKRRWAMRRLGIAYPFHCAMIEPIEAPLLEALSDLRPRKTRLPFVSTVTGQEADGASLDAAYWWRNVRQPVLFRPAVERLAALGARVFVEIGPKPVLRTYMVDTLDGIQKPGVVIASLETDQPEGDIFGRIVAEALAVGAKIDDEAVFGPKLATGTALPHYAWQEQVYRLEPSNSVDFFGRGDDHPLLGYRLILGSGPWSGLLDTDLVPWLADHKVESSTVFPAAGFVEMILSAARVSLGDGPIEVRDLDIIRPILLEDGEPIETRTQIDPTGGLIEIASRRRLAIEAPQLNVKARIARSPGHDPAPVKMPSPVGPSLPADDLYRMTRRFGLDYGPAFQRAASVVPVGEKSLFVRLTAEQAEVVGDSAMALHPTLLDASFHGLFVLIDKAVGTSGDRSFLPVRIGNLRLFVPGSTPFGTLVTIDRASPRSIEASFTVLAADGSVVAMATGVRFKALTLSRATDPDRLVYTTRSVRLMEPGGLVDLPSSWSDVGSRLRAIGVAAPGSVEPDDASLLIDAACRGIAASLLTDLADDRGDLLPDNLVMEGRLAASALCLLHRMAAALVEDGAAEVSEAGYRLTDVDRYPDPAAVISILAAEHPRRIAETMALVRLRRTLASRLSKGLYEGATGVLPAALLSHLDAAAPVSEPMHAALEKSIRDLATDWPVDRPMRVLLIGAGSADVVRRIGDLPALTRIVVTDPDHGRLERTRLDLDESGILEICEFADLRTADGQDEGFDVAGFVDLLARPDGDVVLDVLAGVMAPEGLLIGIEPDPSLFADMVHGQAHTWWRSALDPAQPLGMRPSDRELRRLLGSAFFDAVDAAPLASSTAAARIIHGVRGSAPAVQPEPRTTPVVILVDAVESARRMADALAASLIARGRPVRVAVAHGGGEGAVRIEAADAGSDADLSRLLASGNVKDLVYAPAPSGQTASPQAAVLERTMVLHAVLNGLMQPPARLWIVAPGGSGMAPDRHAHGPVEAAIWGLGRVLMNEYPETETRLIDLVMAFQPSEAAQRLADLLEGCSPERELTVDVRGAAAIRVVTGPALVDHAKMATAAGPVSRTLNIERQGSLDGLAWRTEARPVLGDDQVEIEVAAAGLNFRDVMWALGLLPEEALENGFAGATLGMECSGTITRVGRAVTRFRPGERVITFAPACFSTHVSVSEKALAPVPSTVDLEAAATIPVTFLTAYYALVELARLDEDETVLIHGGAGGVGLAALQIALSRGARVIATAGSEDRRELLSLLGVERVLDSRSLTFADDVMALTGGEGVDVVLNSLFGEAMERSLEVLKPFGRFVELGKRDYYANTHIGLRPFRQNLSYFGVDADQLLTYRPKLTERLFADLVAGFESGVFKALPYRVFPAERATEAFRLMQQSGHVGKIVIRPPALPSATGIDPVQILPDASYLVVGGLGGFGMETARFLVARGARHVALTGRSGRISDTAAAAIEEMRAAGAKVMVMAADAADPASVDRLLGQVDLEMPPLRGIFHTAMVIDDALFRNLDAGRIAAVLEPKIAGAAVLDRASRRYALDLFVLYSSATTLIGNPGQAAYVAANSFLEGLARERHAAGLPALAIAWGAISDAGYLARNGDVNDMLSMRLGKQSLTAQAALDCLGLALDAGIPEPVLAIAQIDWASARRELPIMATPFASLITRGSADGGRGAAGDGELGSLIAGLDEAAAVGVVTNLLAGEISRILRLPVEDIDPARPLTEIGMDSLMALELRMAAEQRLGVDIPLLSLANGAALGDIARRIVEKAEGTRADSADAELAAARHIGEEMDDELAAALQAVEARAADVKRVIG